jgi:nitric oxide reductase activation protein
LARLSRALFDPAYEDSDGFVNKARTLFYAVEDLEDPENARRIGGLLGNDLGQMRIQFDVKSYVVEPVYRDDGLGLWEFPEDAEAQSGEGISIEAALVPEDGTGTSGDDAPQPEPLDAGRAKPAADAEEGIAVATYPEWDRAAQTERPDWTTVREVAVPGGNAEPVERAIEREQPLRRRIERLVQAAKVGRQQRLRRQPAGPEFDLDAVVESAIAARAGREPGELVFKTSARRRAGLATSILIDVSQSTRDPVPALQTSIVELEKLAVAILAAAMEAAGDTFALRAFASDGRHDVRFHRVKDFASPFDRAAKGRLASLAPGFSTRLGAALRHAGSELAPLRSSRKVVLALTDGAPSDIDVADPLDLIEDARRAVFSLRAAGIEIFGILLDPTGAATGASIFGRANALSISRIEDLPGRLSECYFRLTRR